MRLIDADALIDKMVISHTAHSQNSRDASLLNRDVRIVMDMPTAYDVEKVEEQINTYFEKTYVLVGTDCKDITVRACILSILNSVKEIVNLYIRKGGKE